MRKVGAGPVFCRRLTVTVSAPDLPRLPAASVASARSSYFPGLTDANVVEHFDAIQVFVGLPLTKIRIWRTRVLSVAVARTRTSSPSVRWKAPEAEIPTLGGVSSALGVSRSTASSSEQSALQTPRNPAANRPPMRTVSASTSTATPLKTCMDVAESLRVNRIDSPFQKPLILWVQPRASVNPLRPPPSGLRVTLNSMEPRPTCPKVGSAPPTLALRHYSGLSSRIPVLREDLGRGNAPLS